MIIPHVLKKVMQQLDAVRQLPDGSWLARCPAHDDREPSLHITVDGERVLVHCFGGCSTNAVCDALGITPRDLFLRNGHHHEPESSPTGLTLEQFASAKGLDVEHLRRCGVKDAQWNGKPAVAFSYLSPEGVEEAVRLRIAREGDRFRWRNGAKPKELLYGAWWIPLWREKGVQRVLLVEGETDSLSCWLAGIPAVGVAGADCLSEANAQLLDGFEVVLWREPDAGGQKLLESAVTLFADRLKVLQPPAGVKDASELWLRTLHEAEDRQQALKAFRERVNALMDGAQPSEEVSSPIYIPTPTTLRETASRLVDLGTLPEPPPQDWLVKDLIPARFITNLYADSGQGKSFLILYLAMCCLTATPFCGKPVKAGRVLYLDWELDTDTNTRRWYAVCRGAGFSGALQGLLYERMTQPLHAVFPYIRSIVEEHAPVLLVVDSLGKALGTDPREPEKAIRAYHLLEQLPCGVLVIDHQSKMQAEDTYASKTEYGTSYKAHYARSRLQIERIGDSSTSAQKRETDSNGSAETLKSDSNGSSRVGIVIRHKKSNFGALQPDLHLVMTFTNDEAGNLHAVRFEYVKTAEVEAEALGARGEILALLRESDRTVEELENLTGLAASTIKEHLSALRRAGLVEEKGRQGRAKLWGIPTAGSVVGVGGYIDSDGSDGSSEPAKDPNDPFADSEQEILHWAERRDAFVEEVAEVLEGAIVEEDAPPAPPPRDIPDYRHDIVPLRGGAGAWCSQCDAFMFHEPTLEGWRCNECSTIRTFPDIIACWRHSPATHRRGCR